MKREKKSIWCIPVLIFLPLAVFSMEICDNGIDDDNDGLIDLNDSDGSKKQQPLSTGTFSYIVKMEFVNGDTEKSSGNISVIN